MPTYFDTAGIVFSNDDMVFDMAPMSPSADLDEIRNYVVALDQWRRIREQMAAGGVLAKMVTFRDLVKYKLLNLSDATIFDPPIVVTGSKAVKYQLSLSDLTSDIEANTYAGYFRAVRSFTLSTVRLSLLDASDTGSVTVSATVNGSALFSTNISIDVNEKTSVTAAVPHALAITAIPADAEVIFAIVNPGLAARGLEVALDGTSTD